MTRYSVACRNALCFRGGGRWSDEPAPLCLHCGERMATTAVVEVVSLGGPP